MSVKTELLMIEAHRANLASAKSFENYRDQHLAYVDSLIEVMRAEVLKGEVEMKFIFRISHPQPDNKAEQAEPTP